MKFYLLALAVMSMTLSLNAQNPADVAESGKSEENLKTTSDKVQVPEILTILGVLKDMQVDDKIITFKSVLNDGRCPKKVTCVWAGEAEILIEIKDGEESIARKITIPALGFHREILSSPTHKVYIKNLTPYPVKPGENIENYQLLLKIVATKP
ncbi:hypothetical protein [Psychroflexus sediminis]|uniref:Uncharacterized protein n=1 Tax=Psychroflexus sediminis TaxID=470826 RepID=A0A1G7XYH4_9FLAO|nr:hypothetical protein [Psychroflexus sediminis]SDG89218.1 hypothetical protein SAMN04488027_11024 [Psychroflexus sediminis]